MDVERRTEGTPGDPRGWATVPGVYRERYPELSGVNDLLALALVKMIDAAENILDGMSYAVRNNHKGRPTITSPNVSRLRDAFFTVERETL
jgi:hypothetical protein